MTQVDQRVHLAEDSNNGAAAFDEHDHDLKEHLRELTQESVTLIKQEIELLKSELGEKTDFLKEQIQVTSVQARTELEHAKVELAEVVKKAGVGAGLFGGAGLLGLGAFAALTVALIAGIGEAMPVWASALIVTALYGGAAGALAMAGKTKVKDVGSPVPETIGRFKSLFNFRTEKIRTELSSVPAETIDSLSSVKDDLQDAWQRGSQHRNS